MDTCAGRSWTSFLTDVLWGEKIGLLPAERRCYTVYPANLPVAGFAPRLGRTYLLIGTKAKTKKPRYIPANSRRYSKTKTP
jgi:hypothetical protein